MDTPERTYENRRKALQFLWGHRKMDGAGVYWSEDGRPGWWPTRHAATALVMQSAARFIAEARGRNSNDPEDLSIISNWRNVAAPTAANILTASAVADSDVLRIAFRLIALTELRRLIDDPALIAAVDMRMTELDARLRESQRSTGGWGFQTTSAASDVVPSVWAGFAIRARQPGAVDPVAIANIEYLLNAQQQDGSWWSAMFSTRLSASSLVMAYLPVELRTFVGVPDVVVSDIRLEQRTEGRSIIATVLNRGAGAIDGGYTVDFGRVAAGGTPTSIGRSSGSAIAAGSSAEVQLQIANGTTLGDIVATVNTPVAANECRMQNNQSTAVLGTVASIDPAGLEDEQSFLVNVADTNQPPVIRTSELPDLRLRSPYLGAIQVADPDQGDSHLVNLITGPEGIAVNARTGAISYSLTLLQRGQHPVDVEVTDLRGSTARKTLQLRVLRDVAPVITSLPPVVQLSLGESYRYAVLATDEDGDAITYSLGSAPAGMTIDSVTGVINWVPTQAQAGQIHPVSVVVTDATGKSAQQSFSRAVETAPIPPRLSGYNPYFYAPTEYNGGSGVIDANLFDQHSWRLTRAPAGMRLRDGWVVEWTTTTVQHAWNYREYNWLDPHTRCWPADANVSALSFATRWSRPLARPSRPVIAALTDTNSDGLVGPTDRRAIVVIERGTARVHAIDATSGAPVWTRDLGGTVESNTVPAIADVDRDGRPEILVHAAVSGGSPTLVALNADGALKWRGNEPSQGPPNEAMAIAIGDLAEHPGLEIAVGNAVYDSTGRRLFLAAVDRAGYATTRAPYFYDVDGDGREDVVFGRRVYRGDGTLMRAWQSTWTTAPSISHSVPANLDADVALEWIVSFGVRVGNDNVIEVNRVAAFDDDGQQLWITPETHYASMPPLVTDENRDGRADIYVANGRYRVSPDGRVAWRTGRDDGYARNEFSEWEYAGFADLNGDGDIEIINHGGYAISAQSFLHGTQIETAGAGIREVPFSLRHPVVVDVDGDGAADIVTGTDNDLRVYRSMALPWRPAALESPQLIGAADAASPSGYSRAPRSGLAFQQMQSPAPRIGLADLWGDAPIAQPVPGGLKITTRVANRGLRDVTSPVTVTLRDGDSPTGTLRASVTIGGLVAGEIKDVDFGVHDTASWPVSLSVWVDDAATISECDRTNNRVSLTLVGVEVTDLSGLSARIDYGISGRFGAGPTYVSNDGFHLSVGQAWTGRVRISAPGPGDELAYVLVNAPRGMRINNRTGELSWTPDANQVGDHEFFVGAAGFRGAGNPTVQRQWAFVRGTGNPNRAPSITSTALGTANAGAPYGYLPTATDPDNDPLTWSLPIAPAGMSINAGSGAITWTPTAVQVGIHTIELSVTDSRGGTDTQRWVISVSPAINSAPAITSTPYAFAKATRTWHYTATATDPDNDALTWSLTTAPTGMSVDASTGLVTWTPTSAQTGNHPVALRVSDGRAWQEQSFTLAVAAADVPLATTVSIAPSSVAPGGSITVSVATTGAAGPVTTSATMTPPGTPITLDADGETTLTAPTDPGCRTLAVTVTDGFETVVRNAQFCVSDPADTQPPVVALLSPGDNAEITAPVPIRGSVSDANLASWVLAVRPSNSPQATPTILAQGTNTFTDAQIGRFDPTLLINGQYVIILQATDSGGRTASDARVVRVTGDMKLGHFSLTFEEANIPVAGIPVRVTRTYDTRQRNERLDFGYGWSIDYQNVRVRESQAAGFSWRLERRQNGLFPQWCVISNGDRVVTVTLPDGEVESFRARPVPECNDFVPENNVHLVYEPIDGTDSTLEQTNYGLLRVVEIAGSGVANLVDPDSPATPVDPRNYRLTTPEGLTYDLDQNFGVRKVTDLNGQSLTYTTAGVRHSTGIGIDFVRDAEGRIRDLVLPDGEIISYTYTAAGDLASVTDAADQTTQLQYTEPRFAHYLTGIVDPRGVRVVRNEYDDDGRLVATIDADGNRVAFTRDIDGRIEQVRDRRGHLSTYVYDDSGRVLAETNAEGETTTRTYDGDGNVLTETNALGHTMTWTYDPRGNRLTETNALGERQVMTYDGRNSLLTQTDALDRVVIRNVYNSRSGNLVSTTDALGQVTAFDYDSGIGSGGSGELTRMTDALGALTRYIVDSEIDPTNGRGWRIAEIDAHGTRTDYTHDASGRVLTETTTRRIPAAGGGTTTETLVTRHTYDAKGRLTRTEHPDGSATTTTYNGIDKPERECDALARCTVHAYDSRGNRTRSTYADGTWEETGYDANGNVTTQRDRGGRITRMVYDRVNRLIETIHPDAIPASGDDGNPANNPRTRNEYDDAGRLVATVDENGRRTEYRYDDAGRRTQVIAPPVTTPTGTQTAVITTTYDAAGQRTAETDALGRATRYQYDAAGRLTTTVHPDVDTDDGNDANNPRTQVTYDATGRKIAETDEAGRTTRYAYDRLGRLIAVALPNPATGANPALAITPTGPGGGVAGPAPTYTVTSPDPGVLVTAYAYDERGNRVTQTDAAGRSTRWTYDRMGREVSRTLPLGQVETKTYDAAGRQLTHTSFAGQTSRYTYDDVGRLIRAEFADGRVESHAYSTAGYRTETTTPEGVYSWTHDARGRVTRATQPDGLALEYAWDATGNRIAMWDIIGVAPLQTSTETRYAYDARGRLLSLANGADPAVTYEYDAVGNVISERQGALVTTREYDRRNRLRSIETRRAGALVQRTAYSHDAVGRRIAMTMTGDDGIVRETVYGYDAAGRLIEETERVAGSVVEQSRYAYDRVGNRTSVEEGGVVSPASFDANDRMLASGDITFAYDANGNLISQASPAGSQNYRYDARQRLVEATTAAGQQFEFIYDADGNRVGRTARATPAATPINTRFLVDKAMALPEVIAEVDASHAITARYLHGNDLAQQRTHQDGSLRLRYPLRDGQGSTIALADGAGMVTDRYRYTPWGVERMASGDTATAHRYAGEMWERELGLSYNRARWYVPTQGRFTQMDVFAGFATDPRSLHKYGYVHGDPVNGIDPSGLLFMGDLVAAKQIVALLVVGALIGIESSNDFVIQLEAEAIPAAIHVARTNARRGTRGIPTIFYGTDVFQVADHIDFAQSEKAISPILTKRLQRHSSSWVRDTVECRGRTQLGSGKECDEYPFAITDEGGRGRYPSAVSLRPLSQVMNSRAGNRLGRFFDYCGVDATAPTRKLFAVVAVADGGPSGYACRDGTPRLFGP